MYNKDIIIFSSDDWGWKTSKYQLSVRFARNNRVLFVSSIGFRAPTASTQDLSRIFKKFKSFIRGVKKIENNVYVLTPLVLPFKKLPFVESINRVLLFIQINYAKLKLGITNPFVFVFSQNWYGFVKNLPRKILIYYCVDDHSSFKGIDAEQFALLDKKMSQMADLIICSARTIYDLKKSYNESSYYLPHGVNYDLFSSVLSDNSLIVASDISEISKPVLGFWGHISYDWVDVELLKYIAERKPEWNLILIGKYSLAENEFEGYTNIHVIGEKKFEELPSYCKGITIGLIPFIKSKLTDNCNPLKLYEYLAAGLPVVSTDIPEVRQYGELIAVAKTKEDFLAGCEKTLEQVSAEKSAIRSLSVKNASWEQRVEDIYKLINEELP